MGKRGPKPKRAADPEWTPDLAYVCGLMASDGSLSIDGRHIDLTSKDRAQLETFKKIMDLKCKIGSKKSGDGKRAWRVQFGDVRLYRWLISIGITPRKTLTLGAVDVPERYFFDFLRGSFDGDGSSYAYWDTRWHSSVSLYLSFACGSKKHLEWLREKISDTLEIEGIIKRSTGAYVLEFSKTKARKLFEAMYYSSAIPCLARKKQKLERQWEALEKSKKGLQPQGFRRGGPVIRVT